MELQKTLIQDFGSLYRVKISILANGVFSYPTESDPKFSFLEENPEIQNVIRDSEIHVYPRFYRFGYQESFAILYVENTKVIIGPFLFTNSIRISNEFPNIRTEKKEPSCPHFRIETIAAILVGFSSLLNKRLYDKDILIEKNLLIQKIEDALEKTSTKKLYQQIESNQTHHAYTIVDNLEKSLENGESNLVYEAINTLLKSVSTSGVSTDRLRNGKDMAISGIALATRTAIKSGVSCETAYGLSDACIAQIEESETEEALKELTISFMLKLSKTIKDTIKSPEKKIVNQSPIVDQAITYILSHLSDPIEVKSIASYVGVSPNYLSKIFKEETGMALSKYIQKERIAISKKMLLEAGISETDIASYLSFSSQGHFCKVFKEQTGKTPRQFIKEQIALKNL